MATYTYINAVVSAATNRIYTNRGSLGSFTTVVGEKDEHPAVPAERGELPKINVIPIGGETARFTHNISGSSIDLFHEFPIIIVGYYRNQSIDDYLSTVRTYGYNCLDLFTGTNRQVGQAYVTDGTIEFGYWEVVDQVIHFFIIRLNMEIII